jgi:hypothetical protein
MLRGERPIPSPPEKAYKYVIHTYIYENEYYN